MQEEQLKLAEEWYNNPSTTEEVKSHLEELFPELKKREDERIKQDIINYFKAFIPHYDDDLVTKSRKWIAWLKKQGEQKPTCSEEDKRILEIIISVLQSNFMPEERFSGYEEYTNAELINQLKSLKESL